MAKLIAFAVGWLMLGVARAVEIADAPPPEPNYLGIVIFLVLFFGGSALFVWYSLRNKNRDKH